MLTLCTFVLEFIWQSGSIENKHIRDYMYFKKHNLNVQVIEDLRNQVRDPLPKADEV